MKPSTSDRALAFKEAVADTAIGSIINVPMNFVMISIAFYYELTAMQTTIFMTTVFTIFAIVRKMTIRLHFLTKARKKELTESTQA
jgi:hypothetical protein